MHRHYRARFAGILVLGAAVAACAESPTVPLADEGVVPSFVVLASDVAGTDGPFAGQAVVLAGSSCELGRRQEMRVRLDWQVTGSTPVQSFLLWLERADGSDRQVTRKVLGKPRMSGVAAGFEYQREGPWVRARLELYDGSPDYPGALRTTIYVPCG